MLRRFLLTGLLACTLASAAPRPDIKANGSDGPLSLTAGTPITLTFSLDPGDAAGAPADWFGVYTADYVNVFHLDPAGGWVPGLVPTLSTPLTAVGGVPVPAIDTAVLPAGTGRFYFGVDLLMNGALDLDRLAYDFVEVTVTPAAGRLQPSDFHYLGAFRLPGGDTPPLTFAYGGNATAYNPHGDPGNADAYPGSLFVMGHDRIAYGQLPDGNQVAEVTIPTPAVAPVADLPQAAFLQDFHNVLAGRFPELEEIPRAGLCYLDHPATGPKLHLAFGQHLQAERVASHAWVSPTLDTPDFQGAWFIGDRNLYSVNGYLFELPAAWADAHTGGRYLATGRMRDGGQGGMGPALFAYTPWQADGSAPPAGTRLQETALLLYENADATEQIVRAMTGYQHPDEWEGGAFITTASGRSALLFAGTKSLGSKYWYGFRNPRGADYPCVDTHITDFPTCRTADGGVCPAEDFAGCCDDAAGTCLSYRGWWSTRMAARFILYDPADLARVAAGSLASWEPQPYASLDIDDRLYLSPPEWDVTVVGEGVQRRYRVGDVAYDRARQILYVLEQLADGGKPVVHVWRVD